MKKLIILLLTIGLLTSFSPKKEMTWMAIGDSITFHNGRVEYTRGRITKAYLDRVTGQLPYIHSENHGYPGWTAKAMADNINNIGLKKADFYTIFLGTNDWWTNLPIGSYSDYQNNTGNSTSYGSYRTMIDKIKSLNSDAVIILITPLQRTDYVDINDINSTIHGGYKPNKDGHFLSEYADAVKDIAKKGNFKLVDLYYKSGITLKNAVNYKRLRDPKTGEYKNYTYPDYTDIPFNPKTDEYPYPVEAMNMTYDGLHPSDKAHQIIADMLVKVMKKY